MRSLTIGIVLVAMLAAATTAIPALADAQEPEAPAPIERSGPAFEMQQAAAAIDADREVHLLVSLALPDAATRSAGTAVELAVLREQVATAQQSVLATMSDAALRSTPAEAADFEVRRQFEAIPALAVTIQSNAALELLAQSPAVVGIQIDSGGTGTLAESVAFTSADQRHAVGNLGEGVTVAVLDSGADLDHPDLVDDILATQACFGDDDGTIDGVGFCPNGSDSQSGPGAAEDDAGHGTHVTGIVTSAGTVSAPGVAPGAEIVSIKIVDNCNSAGCFYFFSEIVAAWDWIINNNDTLGIDIVNMSFSTDATFPGDCDAAAPAIAASVGTLRSLGITPFAATGNSGGNQVGAPACLSQVISVGASDNFGNAAGFSDSNAVTDIFAPGVNVLSLGLGGGTQVNSGTSMASPHAAGCAALLFEAGDATTPDAIEARLESSAFKVIDRDDLSFPRIDCSRDDITTPPCVDDGESNDTAQTATPLGFATDFAAQICPDDADWYSFDLLVGESVDVSALFTHADGDLDAALISPSGGVFRLSASSTDNEVFSAVAPETGTYLLLVVGFGQTENAYTVRADVTSCSAPVFDDVPQDPSPSFFTDPVYWAACTGVTTGTTATTFTPNATVTRGQLATFLWRYAGEPPVSTAPSPFVDVPPGRFFTDPVRWMVDEGITTGTTATTFSPNAAVTRAQLATFLWRFAREPMGAPDNSFVDVPDGRFFTLAVDWLSETGITTGTTATTFSPNRPLTRGQAVTFLARLDAQRANIF